MIDVIQPKAAQPDFRRETVKLLFEDRPSREFFMRGALAWPEGERDGFVIVAGLDLANQNIWIFREFPFISVEHFYSEGDIVRKGLFQFFDECRSRFYCQTYFFSQPDELHHRFTNYIYKTPTIPWPKPEFIRVRFSDQEIADNIIREALVRDTLHGNRRESKVFNEIFGLTGDDEAKKKARERSLPIHALRCLLAGYEYYPWVDPGPGFVEIEYKWW